MMDFLAGIIIWLNIAANALGKALTVPVSVLPGWLSNTIISAMTGVILLVIFKYTSNQHAIGRVRDNIKAQMLALKLFKDSMSVTLQVQGQLFKGAFLLLFYAIVPLLVMVLPVVLLLGQMGLWYQARPLLPGEQALVIVKLNAKVGSAQPSVSITSIDGAEVTTGQTKVLSKNEIWWEIKARQSGHHRIVFEVDGERVEKTLAIGEGFMRVSAYRPGRQWSGILLHPTERPFGPDSLVESISINYPDRAGFFSGTDWWVVYFFIASMIFALLFKPFLKVRI